MYHDLCFDQKVRKISEFSFKITILQILTSLHNAWACLHNVICHFCEIIIISMKLLYKCIVGRTVLVYSSTIMSLTSGRAFTGFSCLQLGVMAFLQLNCVCIIISTFVVGCLNIKGTTFVLFPARRTCPFITKSKVSLNIILALFYKMNHPSDFT